MKQLIRFVFLDRWSIKFFILFMALISTITGILTPYYQKKFLQNFDYSQLFISALLMLLSFVCYQLTLYISQKESLVAQKKLAGHIYKHILFLKEQSKSSHSVGELTALYTTDVPSSTVWLEQSLPYLLTTFLPLIITPFFLNHFYYVPYMDSLSVILGIVLFYFFMARRQSRFFAKFKSLAAARIALVNEWLQNMKNLRLLGWISIFEKKIFNKREVETQNRVAMVTNGQFMNAFSSSITFWLNFIILFYFLSRLVIQNSPDQVQNIDKKDILVLIWIVGVFLSRPLRQLPWLLTLFFDAWTSIKRLHSLLSIQNIEPQIENNFQPQNEVLHIKNLNLSLQNKSILKNIHLDIQKGEIVSVVGPVGSGKTMLLKSIIQETPFTADEFFCEKVNYLPQEPFIFSSSIHNNLTFEYDHPAEQKKAMESLDLAHFSHIEDNQQKVLETRVGERGLSLSGGQKQRLNLARLFYNKTPLYLLDDPFSAVDIKTEKALISSLKKLKNEGSTFIVVSQRLSFVKYSDRVILLEKGEIKFNGTYARFLETLTPEEREIYGV